MVYGRGDSNDRDRVQAQKVCIYRSDHWIVLKFFYEFSKAIFHRVARNRYATLTASLRGIPPKGPEYRLKRSVTIDMTVKSHSNFFTSFRRPFSMDLHGIGTGRGRRPVEAIPPKGQEYRLNRSVTIDPTVGSPLNFFTRVRMLFSMELHGIRTRQQRPVEGIPMTRIEYRLKSFVSIGPTVGSRSNLFTSFGGCFPCSCV